MIRGNNQGLASPRNYLFSGEHGSLESAAQLAALWLSANVQIAGGDLRYPTYCRLGEAVVKESGEPLPHSGFNFGGTSGARC